MISDFPLSGKYDYYMNEDWTNLQSDGCRLWVANYSRMPTKTTPLWN